MTSPRYNKARHDFGKKGEAEALPLIELVIGETLTPTEKFYDTMDAVSDNYWVEIKTRSSKYHHEDAFIVREGWLVPACKIERAKQEAASGKKTNFYYYWKSDNSLWELEWDESKTADLTPSVPSWHADKQLHYYIPQDRWVLVVFVPPE